VPIFRDSLLRDQARCCLLSLACRQQGTYVPCSQRIRRYALCKFLYTIYKEPMNRARNIALHSIALFMVNIIRLLVEILSFLVVVSVGS